MSTKDLALSSEIANFTYKKLDSNNRLNHSNFSSALRIIENNFQNISNLAKDNNSDLYLVVFPWPETLINGQSEFNWEIFANNLCAKNNCNELINLFEDFKKIRKNKKNWKNLIYIDDDVHFKRFGNEIIALKILEKFKN